MVVWLAIGGCARLPARGAAVLTPPREPARTVHFAGSNDDFANPERGFYVWANSIWVGTEMRSVDGSTLREQRKHGLTLVRMYYVIDEFRDAPLSLEALAHIQADFDAVRQAGLKMIPRFTYNFPLGGLAVDFTGVEDAPVGRVRQHIEQLAPLLRANSDVIAFLEAGFVGAWGEWHHSSNGLVDPEGAANGHSRAILEDLLAALPPTRAVTLRYPHLKQQLFGSAPLLPDTAFTGAPRARIGALNDCFLRNAIDGGTYARPGTDRTPRRFIEAQKRYLGQDNRFVPQGGETCAADAEAGPYIGCARAVEDLRRMRWSAVNLDYHPEVIGLWRRERCLDEIRQRLGYRFRLLSAELPDQAALRSGGPFRLSFTIVNDGWAAPYNARLVEVILRHAATGERYTIVVDADPRFWGAGETHRVEVRQRLPAGMPAGGYQILLNLPAPERRLHDRPEYSIRLANQDLWETETGFNDLKQRLVLVASE